MPSWYDERRLPPRQEQRGALARDRAIDGRLNERTRLFQPAATGEGQAQQATGGAGPGIVRTICC